MKRQVLFRPGLLTVQYRGLNRSLYVLFAARIVNRMGDFVQLFLVLYLTGRLGFDEAAAGRFIMMTGIMNGAGVALAGYLVDRFGRKGVLIISQLVFAAAYAVCGFLPVSMAVPWLIFFSSAFRGATWPVTNAMVTDLSEGPQRQVAFSLLYLGTNIGVAAGPLIAGLLYNEYLQWIFWGDALTTLISAAAILLYVKDTKPSDDAVRQNRETCTDGERAEEGSFLRAVRLRPVLLIYLLIALVVSFVYSQHQFSLPLQVNSLFGDSGPRLYGYMMTVNAMVVLICTAVLTALFRNVHTVLNMAIASVFYMAGFGMVMWIGTMPMFFLSTLVWTLGEILMVTNSNVFVAESTPITHRGRFYSLITLVHGFGFAFSPWVSGMLIEQYGIMTMWPVTAAAAAAAAIAFITLYYGSRNMTRRTQKDP